ncbi:MAG: adenosylcobinamide-GDP ribazoletransferase [Aliishimia sp.]
MAANLVKKDCSIVIINWQRDHNPAQTSDMKKQQNTTLVHPNDVLVAGALLTRLPLPHAPDSAFARQSCASWSYPIIGAGLGLLAACVWWVAGLIGLPAVAQAGLSLAALAVMTGGLHEDGLADTVDGLWGGYDPKRRLEIMKDSHIGSYGVLALVFGVGLRWSAVLAAGPWALIAATTLSRGVLPGLMITLPFARQDGLARSVGMPPHGTVWLSLAISLLIAAAIVGLSQAVLALVCACVVTASLGLLARRKIGGITGDICGAAQQLSELAVLFALVI